MNFPSPRQLLRCTSPRFYGKGEPTPSEEASPSPRMCSLPVTLPCPNSSLFDVWGARHRFTPSSSLITMSASESKLKIFFTGATGYIGGSVLQRLLQHPKASTFQITTLVRSPQKAKTLNAEFGVEAVVGSYAELDKLAELSEQADVVFSCVRVFPLRCDGRIQAGLTARHSQWDQADADDLDAVQAFIRGLKARHEKTGKRPILIHTSGTGVLTDHANGKYASDKIYHDSRLEEMESLPDTQLHRNVDLTIINADKSGWLYSYIVTPSTIYGIARGPLFDSGLANRHSAQIPGLIKASLARGRAGVVGEGKPIWNDVHIEDLAEFYAILFDRVLADPEGVPHGRTGIYLLENGEHSWYDISKAIGQAMVELGLSSAAEPTSFTDEEMAKVFGSVENGYQQVGQNSRGRGEQARALGWKPKHTTADMLASIKPEVEAILEKQRSAK
ncbi:hypothetical protein BN946_scf184939.g47 [Trametes cinnabarina]|uniref:NAD(P)-binding domain-containing protein n=1 Tax=Pycnoporus cinnabarinus TaxID=5643 RepID=A0A060SHE4_PYCCI|nr:hypothetical protein BN946_scf184939.g47 [Trametes cinnabarina]